ncbi:hypothetical protein [Glaciibacter superstes]|uniref:hypothetical protein n=1 Tax=Glaciibacter superstes TaxID=501023 RepID=UPI0003B42CDC|nr:hypothetical protein [Glaciibacter superstes]
MTFALAPVALSSNQPERTYRGGEGISRLRRETQRGEFHPEDFVASTTEVFSGGGVGLSSLPDGRLLRDAVTADPIGYLGREHVARFGASTEILVKILDTAERLFVHFHPAAGFAAQHLSLGHGKTEAWIVVAVREIDDDSPHAHLGFTRDVSEGEIEQWVGDQGVTGMLGAMHRVELRQGSTLFVPAGVPHSIGPGITLVELQEPTDLSVLLEATQNGQQEDAFLGLDRAVALSALDRHGWTKADLSTLTATRQRADRIDTVTQLFPALADPFFRAEWIRADGSVLLDTGYSVLIVLDGAGELTWDGGIQRVRGGESLLLPHSVGDVTLSGKLSAIRARPPAV